MDKLQPLYPVRLDDLAAHRMLEWILEQGLQPGDKLPTERELVRQLNVSRPVVREALTRLKAMGVIERHQGRGSFITHFPVQLVVEQLQMRPSSEKDWMMHVWEVRRLLETQIAGLAAERRTDGDLARLEEALSGMEAAIESGRDPAVDDEHFHLYLTHASKNPVLIRLMMGVSSLVSQSVRRALAQPGRPGTSLREHREILQAVRAGDALAARQAMERHLAYGQHLTTGNLTAPGHGNSEGGLNTKGVAQ